MSRKDLSFGAVFGAPIVLAVLSLIGLVGALLNDGAWDWLGSALLASVVVAATWAWVRARDARRPAPRVEEPATPPVTVQA